MRSELRAFLLFVACLAILVALFIFILSHRVTRIMREQIVESVKHQAAVAEIVIRPVAGRDTGPALAEAARDLADRSGNRVTVIDGTGRVIADTEHDPAAMDNHLNRQEVREALDTGWGVTVRRSNTLDIEYLYVARRMGDGPDPAGCIRLAVPLDKIGALNRGLFWLIAGLAAGLLVLAALTGYYYSTMLRQPLREVAVFCQELKAGNFRARLLRPARGRVAGLYRNLNAAAENLETSFQTISRERDILAGVLAALDEGVAVTDESGSVITVNDSFRRQFAAGTAPEKRNIWEIIRDARFLELIDLNKTDRSAKTREIRFADTGKTCAVRVFFTPVFQGWVYAFQDVTEARNLERNKADFITNLSHELRTPLTAIKGYLETLEDGAAGPEDQAKYLKTVRENTDRIIALVSDLLTLSEAERPVPEADHTRFDLNQLAREVVVLFQKEAQAKNLAFDFEPRPVPEFFGDRFMIQQLIMNLVSNALRFTEKGRVALDITYRSGDFTIRVSDTGIGIPEDELPRIFERFYRIDKARSRASGGTGLGLAIVKHVVQAHGGQITVESRLGQGTTFLVRLPQRV